MPLVPCVWEGEEADVAEEEADDEVSSTAAVVVAALGLDAPCEAGEEEGEGATLELGLAELLLLLESSDGSDPALLTKVEEGKAPATT